MASYKQQLATAKAKMAALQTKIEELTPLAEAEPDTTVDLSALVGTSVFARIGRCTTSGGVPRIVEAVVLAAKNGEGKAPDQVKVTYGDGFDAEISVVPVTAIATTREAADAQLAAIIADYNKAREAAEKAAAAAEAAAATAEVAAEAADVAGSDE